MEQMSIERNPDGGNGAIRLSADDSRIRCFCSKIVMYINIGSYLLSMLPVFVADTHSKESGPFRMTTEPPGVSR